MGEGGVEQPAARTHPKARVAKRTCGRGCAIQIYFLGGSYWAHREVQPDMYCPGLLKLDGSRHFQWAKLVAVLAVSPVNRL
jgi:hypothetical protein